MGQTVLFVDVENVGFKEAYDVITSIIEQYSPIRKELVFAVPEKNLPVSYRTDKQQWSLCRCKKGKNAADKVIQLKIKQELSNPDIERIILATSDHGFAPVCSAVLNANIKLVLISSLIPYTHLHDKIQSEHKKTLFTSVWIQEYLNQTIFIRSLTDGTIYEIPFKNGMKQTIFIKLLKRYHLWSSEMQRRLYEMLIEVRSDHVNIVPEEKIWIAFEKYSDSGQTILMRHPDTQKLVEVPFLNGMSINDFALILKLRGLWHKRLVSQIQDYFLEIINNHVFIMSEKRILTSFDYSIFFSLRYVHPNQSRRKHWSQKSSWDGKLHQNHFSKKVKAFPSRAR